ncbi:MAG TPA: outer membrane lipoprotein-sorting protein [candidate division WOR-3 bacterium]|uniref:Outer membrane lipoprotein-sorting protein n=1 Tax=candidate division WOR-3 bacterium TaxID=2052148 RepID=A0A7C5I4J0_UNCW3|nr:outer membrane lipoprotein-sorting protein [candidate division WOR-3 bacterium]
MVRVLCTLLIISGGILCGELTPQQILTRVDSVSNAPLDRKAQIRMILVDKNGKTKERLGVSYEKKENKRLIKFLEPAQDRGIGFLSLPGDVMYVYFPAFKKVRRIASHVKNTTFAGTDFTYEELSTFTYSEDYNASLLEETDSVYVLKLLPKPGVKKEYSHLIMWVDKENFVPRKIEFFDKGGNLWKILSFRKITKKKNYWIPLELEMKDLKKQHLTRMVIENLEVDVGLPDEFFTKRYLVRLK